MKHSLHFFAFILSSLLLASCTPNKSEDTVVEPKAIEEVIEYPSIIIDTNITTSIQETTSLYPISKMALEEFLNIAQEYEGVKPTVVAPFPTDWGAIGFERLPDGREMLLVQSENREWKYIIITTGYGVQRVLDAFPVALNLAILNDDVLETEIWSTERTDDGKFLVNKQYEWTRSVEEVNYDDVAIDPSAFNRKERKLDTYAINELGQIEYTEQENTLPYSAAIFYFAPSKKPIEWDEDAEMLKAFCEDNAIIFAEYYENFENITITDYKFNEITTVDLSPYISADSVGIILMQHDQAPKNIPFGNYERMRIELLRYFKIMMVNEYLETP